MPHHMITLVYLDVKDIHHLNSFLRISFTVGWQDGSEGKVLAVKPALDPTWKIVHQHVLTSTHKPKQLKDRPTHKGINAI